MLSLTLLALPLLAVATTHDVNVGAGGLTFSPEALSANVGDMVVFHFVAKNHTASQSSFASPCGQLDGGFDSGFNPVAPNTTANFPTFTYTVTGTAPVWVHCRQGENTAASHCGQGMVFAINCPQDSSAPNSFSNFKASALAIGAQLQAGASAASATPAAAVTPAAASPVEVTDTVTLASSTWTTTYTSFPNSPNPTPASLQGNVHVVTVGGNSTLTYDPPHIVAQPRDIISFQFASKNHTATQSTFANPCKFMGSTTPTPGFDSGFMPIANGSAPSVWNITVNDTAPIWVYCRQKTPIDHCGKGMVFAVNSDESSSSQKTFSIFQAAAQAEEANTTASTPGSSQTPASGSSAASNTRVSTGLALALVGAAFAFVL